MVCVDIITRRERWSTAVWNCICILDINVNLISLTCKCFPWDCCEAFSLGLLLQTDSVSWPSQEAAEFSVLCCSGCLIDGRENNARGLQNLQYLKFSSREINYFWVMFWNQPGSAISLLVQETVRIVWGSVGTEVPWLCLQLLAVSLLPVRCAAYLKWLLAAVELCTRRISGKSACRVWKKAVCYLVLVFCSLPRGVWVTNAI